MNVLEQIFPQSLAESETNSSPDPDIWRTGLLLATSAVLGGIALVVWNRRTLARIRQQYESRLAEQEEVEQDVSN
jgi:hypothetical protein